MLTKKLLLIACWLLIYVFGFGQQSNNDISSKYGPIKKYLMQAGSYSFFSSEYQENLDSALAILPNEAAIWQMKAMPYFKCRKYEVGMQFLDKAVALDPKEWLGYRAFIKCIFSKNYAAALMDYADAEKLKGNYTMMEHPYSFFEGICYLQLNKFDSALICFNKTVQAESPVGNDPNIHFMDWFYLGITNYELKNYETAIAYFDKTLERYSNLSEAEFYKAVCLHKLKIKKEEMDRLFEAAQTDFGKGYSFTEDNCVYEKYPYQLSKYVAKFHGIIM